MMMRGGNCMKDLRGERIVRDTERWEWIKTEKETLWNLGRKEGKMYTRNWEIHREKYLVKEWSRKKIPRKVVVVKRNNEKRKKKERGGERKNIIASNVKDMQSPTPSIEKALQDPEVLEVVHRTFLLRSSSLPASLPSLLVFVSLKYWVCVPLPATSLEKRQEEGKKKKKERAPVTRVPSLPLLSSSWDDAPLLLSLPPA